MEAVSLQSSVLMGWKEIATYLNMGVRTLQSYEAEQKLPIRRPAGGPRGAVIAMRAELDTWLVDCPKRPAADHYLSPLMIDSPLEPLGVAIARNRQLRSEMRQRRTEVEIALTLLQRSLQAFNR